MSAIPLSKKTFPRTVSVEVTTEVDVELSDVLAELTTDEVVSLARSKGLVTLDAQEVGDLARLLRLNDLEGALLLLDRMMPSSVRGFAHALQGERARLC